MGNVEPGSVNRGGASSEDSDADSIVIHDEEEEEEEESEVVVVEKKEKKKENKLAKYQIKSVPKWFDALSKRALSADLKIECFELKPKEDGYADEVDGIWYCNACWSAFNEENE